MTQELRYIVERLNAAPFSRRYNLVSFDSLDPPALLQVLNDVLAEISPEHRMDLREEPPDQTAIRIFSLLRILHYTPKTDKNTFIRGLLDGDKTTVYPLLHWLLERCEELKKRAYLAKFLVKVEVPAEHLQDEAAVEMHTTYHELVEQFKELHRTVEKLRSSEFNVADVRKDITAMEEEKELLLKRIERLKKRAAALPMQAEMFELARNLRLEKDRELSLGEQRTEQKNHLLRAQQRVSRLDHQLEEARQSTEGLTPRGLITKLSEENHVKSILIQDSLPRSIQEKRRECIELEKVVTEPLTGDADLDAIRDQMEETKDELSQLMEKHMPGQDPVQDKLTLFRQQASIISRKKQTEAENYKGALDELAAIETELKEKEDRMSAHMKGGGEVIREEEFKRIVAKLRPMHKTYQQRKGELSLLIAESGVLARTEEILKSRDQHTQELVATLEEKKGVRGYVQAQETLEKVSATKNELDERKEEKLRKMTITIEELNEVIRSKKTLLAPLLKEVRPVRQQHKELDAQHAEKKVTFDAIYVGLEAKRSQLESEVHQLWEEKTARESRYHYLQALKQSIELQQQKVAAEMKSYTTTGGGGGGGEGGGGKGKSRKSLRDQYTRKILEQENLGRALRDKQKDVRANHDHNLKQVKMWRDLRSLLKAKQESYEATAREKAEEKVAQQAMIDNPDRLVLT